MKSGNRGRRGQYGVCTGYGQNRMFVRDTSKVQYKKME